MTYDSKQHKLKLTENTTFSRKLLLREGILNIIHRGAKKLSRLYHGSDDPFDTMVAGARASRIGNYERLKRSSRDLENETKKVRQEFSNRQRSLHPAHPERLENQFRAETGNPHVHVPSAYVKRAFDPAAAYATIQADPATSSLDRAVKLKILSVRQKSHEESEDRNEAAHKQSETQKQETRDQEFRDFGERKFKEHVQNIITTNYHHPLTSSQRISDRDKNLYNLAYKSGGKLDKYRRLGDIARGLLSQYVSPSDSPEARFSNIVGHELRRGGKQQELSPSGVSEPYSSGDSEHAPR